MNNHYPILNSNPPAHTPHSALRSPLSAIQAAMVVPLACFAFLSTPLRLAAACTYSISPALTNVPPTATTGSFRVTTTTGCPWTALANSGWILITSGSNGTGSGTVTYMVAATTNVALRVGTIAIAGYAFTIRQNGDTTHPTSTITSPAPGQQWSNALFTAQGTAGDNVRVAKVVWRLNGSAWSNATTLNNWTNWAADLSLVTGANTLAAYAVDAAGNTSATNNVSFTYVYVPTRIIGLGGNLSFGAVMTNTTATRTLTITNSGNSALNINGISYPAGFSGAWSGSVAASGSANVTVTFAPTALASYAGTVTVTSDAVSGVNTISASGSGTLGFVATPIIGLGGNLNFGAVITNTTATRMLTITNSGNSTLNVTGLGYPAGFSGAWSGSIAASRSTNVMVTFAPTAVTSYGGTVTVTSDATSGVNTISASGSGIPASQQILISGVNYLPGGHVQLSVRGLAGDVYLVLGSTDLHHWQTIASITNLTGTMQFADPGAASYSRRFYRLRTSPNPYPSSMAFIPAGVFTMGDALDGISDAVPTVTVIVSSFYMDTNLVSYSQWQSVYNWATNHGYGFVNAGAAKTANHPVGYVSWYDVVKWCNARSQQAGLTPVYYTDTGLTRVYTNGQATPYANWTANGFRLPTEAEWEKAARGGLSGQRFPWGDTISESQATYYSQPGFGSFDLGPNGYNAIGLIGGYPYTSPVGSFAANGYGLYDMAGNVFEWCWDWYGTPYAGGPDPRGPASGSSHVLRGGVWYGVANFCRSAWRWNTTPENFGDGVGFRTVLPYGQ